MRTPSPTAGRSRVKRSISSNSPRVRTAVTAAPGARRPERRAGPKSQPAATWVVPTGLTTGPAAARTGRTTVKVLPLPGADSTLISPPWAST